MIRALSLTGPVAAALLLAFVVLFFFDSFDGDVDADLLRLGPVLAILFPLFALMLFLRALMNGPVPSAPNASLARFSIA